jgi:hypothetical protein
VKLSATSGVETLGGRQKALVELTFDSATCRHQLSITFYGRGSIFEKRLGHEHYSSELPNSANILVVDEAVRTNDVPLPCISSSPPHMYSLVNGSAGTHYCMETSY